MQWLQRLQRMLRRYGPATSQWLRWTGIVLLLTAAVCAGRSWRSTRGQMRCVATVTENVATFAPGGGVRYVPRLRFRLPTGELVLALSSSGSDEIDFPAGESVPVMYAPGQPQNARIATVWRLYSAAIILGVLGVIVLDLGLILQRMA